LDFVVVGLGVGAFAVLLGLAIRDLGPFFRRIPRAGTMPWSEVAERVAWGRRCRAAGLVVAIAGATLCLITGISLLARVGDSTGMWIVLAALVAGALAIALWAFRYQAHVRAPSIPSPIEEANEERERPQRPARKSALAGIRSSRPNVSRRPADDEPADSSKSDRPDPRPAADAAAPMGALTVDASGAMRRTPIGVQSEPTAPTSRPQRPTQASTPAPARGQRNEGQSREPRNSGRGGSSGGDSFR
jgi:hypothetical protein